MATEVMEGNKKEQLMNSSDAEHTRSGKVYVPRADIYETQEQLVVLADMPGVKQDAIDITLEQNILTIYGKVLTKARDKPRPLGLGRIARRTKSAKNNLQDY